MESKVSKLLLIVAGISFNVFVVAGLVMYRSHIKLSDMEARVEDRLIFDNKANQWMEIPLDTIYITVTGQSNIISRTLMPK